MTKNFETQFYRIKGITGTFYSVPNRKTNKLVIYAKGAPTCPDDGYLSIAPVALDYDIDIFVPDYIGYGRSDGDFTPMNCIKTLLSLYDFFSDGGTMINHYEGLTKTVKYKDVYFVGMSFGGAYVPLLPRFNKKIKNICLLCPVVDYASCGSMPGEETMKRFMKAMTEDGYQYFYRGILTDEWQKHFNNADGLSPMDNTQHLNKANVFIGHGKEDVNIHYTKSEKFFNLLKDSHPNKNSHLKLRLYRNGAHGYTTTRYAIKDYFKWMKIPKAQK